MIYKDLAVLSERCFWKTNMKFAFSTHPVKIEVLMAKDGVFVEDFVKLTKFEADDLVVMQALKVPVLLHYR